MKPQGNGLIEMHDDKGDRGFSCMQLIKFLFDEGDKYEDWDKWHGAHTAAANGNCPFKLRCPNYKKTLGNHPPKQLDLFKD